MCHSASISSAVPFRVQAYVETIVHACADGGQALVSVVLFGSAAIGGWVETVSDVDLILVVPDCATDGDMDRLRSEVERIGILHRLCSHSAHGQPALEKFLNRVTAHDRSFFICTRGDLLSGNIGRILRLHPSQAIFVDRVVLANFVASGITVWGEALLPFIPVAPIRRFDVFKALFGLLPMATLSVAIFPLHPGMTKYAMGVLKSSVHSCFFCYELRRASLEEEISFFERRLGIEPHAHSTAGSASRVSEVVHIRRLLHPNSGAAPLADIHRQPVSARSPKTAPIAISLVTATVVENGEGFLLDSLLLGSSPEVAPSRSRSRLPNTGQTGLPPRSGQINRHIGRWHTQKSLGGECERSGRHTCPT